MTITDFQRRLQALGYDPGAIDGIGGPRTAAALEGFLGAQGLPMRVSATRSTLSATGPVALPVEHDLSAWDSRSARSLAGVHPDLIRVATRARALAPRPFVVIEGLRSLEDQRAAVARGASQTLESRHLTGHAIDCVPLDANGTLSWDWSLYPPMAAAFKRAAAELGIAITWGGDWKTLRDGPHFELDRTTHPA